MSQIGWDAKQPGCRTAAPPHYSGAVTVSTDARTRTNLDRRELASISLLRPDQRRPPDRSCTAEARGSALSTSLHGDDGRFRIQSENAWDRRRPQSHVPVFASSVTLAQLSWTGAGLRFNPPPGRSGTCSPAPADNARPPQSSSGLLRWLSRIPGAFDRSAPDADLEARLRHGMRRDGELAQCLGGRDIVLGILTRTGMITAQSDRCKRGLHSRTP